MIVQRRSRVIDCVVMLTCAKTARIVTSASAVVAPSRSPIIVDVRCGRSTSVATIVATTRRSGSKGKSSRQVGTESQAAVCCRPSENKHMSQQTC